MDVAVHYYDFADPFPGANETADVAAGRTPTITWWGADLPSMASGSQDAVMRAAAARVRDFGHPVFVRFAAEMNGDWYAWSGSKYANGPELFKAAWRRAHTIFDEAGATNVAWVWAPNSESKPGGRDPLGPNSWRLYYPGDDVVDWVGIDGYNWGTSGTGNTWESFGTIFGPIYADYADRKPVMIAESSSVEAGGSKAAWISDAATWIRAHGGVKALVWFDTTYSSTGLDWRIDSSATAFDAVRRLANDQYFAATTR